MANCSTCSKNLAHGTRHDLCRACRYPPRPARFCSLCDARINAKQNKSGICRTCRCALNRMGDVNRLRIAKLAESNRDPKLKVTRVKGRWSPPVPPIRRPVLEPHMTAFERAMERVRNGAGISIVRPIPRRVEPSYTLGGVSSI